jgi:hypothetical protein
VTKPVSGPGQLFSTALAIAPDALPAPITSIGVERVMDFCREEQAKVLSDGHGMGALVGCAI